MPHLPRIAGRSRPIATEATDQKTSSMAWALERHLTPYN